MTARARRIRTAVRTGCAGLLALFTWYALSRVAAGAPDGLWLAVGAAGILIVLVALLSRRAAR